MPQTLWIRPLGAGQPISGWRVHTLARLVDGMAPPPVVLSTGITRDRRPPTADERTTAQSFLRWHRATLLLKCSDLDPEQLARRPVHTSALSLLGLVRHATESERFWFRVVMAGADAPPLYSSESGHDQTFEVAGATPDSVAQAFDAWHAEVGFGDRLVQAAPDLDSLGNEPGEGPVSLRWVLAHLLEEYARHNGHADLLREQIDGTVGL
jgi:uncharacterized damage-inducible protein DinB